MIKRPPHTLRPVLSGLAVMSLFTLAACKSADTPLPSTQVAAKVGTEEISMHQINTVMALGGGGSATPEQMQTRSRAVLEGLIDQQLAVDQAVESKLNRSPDVMAQLEAARREVLARAYVKQFAATQPRTDPGEAQAYYDQHPALFSQRRIFSLQEVVTARSPEVQAQLERMSAESRPLEEVAAWLKARNLPFVPGAAIRSAEQIPMDVLPRMHAMKDGQSATFLTPTAITQMRLVSSRTAPVTAVEAMPRIEQYLGNLRMSEAITAHMKALRGNTTVAYMGEFQPPAAGAAGSAPAAAPATAPAAGVAPSMAPAATPAATLESPAAPGSATMEKGLAGLK